MRSPKETHSNTYNLNNCFGFNECEVDTVLWNNSSILNSTIAPMEFQENKPFRLALYVRPSEHRRLHRTKAPLLVKNANEKQAKNKKNESNIGLKLCEKSEVSKSKRKKNIKNDVMLFDENVKPGNVSKRIKKTPEKTKPSKEVTIPEMFSKRKSILREVNTKPVITKTRQNKIRRSYERKFKESKAEKIPEPPSEEIIKDMDLKRLTRTKQKKTAKEEQEFEKWADNMNSAFDDVEKFELSIAYD